MYYKSEQNFKKASNLISIRSISRSVITITLVYFIGYIGLYLGLFLSLLIQIIIAKDIFPKIKKLHPFSEHKELIRIGFPILVVGIVWSIMIGLIVLLFQFLCHQKT